jgi:arsenate reductase
MMLLYPVLVNRPFVVTPKGVKLCRPSETVLELLPQPPQTLVHTDGGTLLFDPLAKRAL